MQLVDSHCHLHFEKFGLDREEVYQNSINAGVTRMVCVGTTLADSRAAADFADDHEGVWASVGAHPHEAEEVLADKNAASTIAQLAKADKVIAIGEIGLDHYKSRTPQLIQEKAFRAQVEAGLPTGLPFIFHVRDAWRDFWRIFDDYDGLRGVVHSFSSGTKQLDAALSRDLYVGLNGIMTFTNDHAQLDAAKQVPLDKLLLETDAPFLAPASVRGSICEPKHVMEVAEFLAGLRQEPLEELAAAITKNAINLFKLT